MKVMCVTNGSLVGLVVGFEKNGKKYEYAKWYDDIEDMDKALWEFKQSAKKHGIRW